VIVEILNDDGAMARRDDLKKFARRHQLKLGTIADLIRYRLATEQSVEQIGDVRVETPFGPFRMLCFEDHVNQTVHLALVRGTIEPGAPTLVRVHRQETLSDVVGVLDLSLHRPLRDAMRVIAEHGSGVIVILRPEESARELMRSVGALGAEREPVARGGRAMDLRTFGIGAQILRALGVKKMRVLSAPKHMHGLSGFGLEVAEYIPCEPSGRDEHNG
jgi:3,4-dihydroxy 2-butanone 4-phosphate synthase/GTP cyclohydrolase II